MICPLAQNDPGMMLNGPSEKNFLAVPTPTDFCISSEVVVGDTRVPAMDIKEQSRSGVKIPNPVDFISIYATVPGTLQLACHRKIQTCRSHF